MKKIAFLIGAGCEVQLELSSGIKFKRDTIVADGVKTLMTKISGITDMSDYGIQNGTILSPNSYNTLYQTIVENGIDMFHFNKSERKIVEAYIRMRRKTDNADEKKIREKFRKLYKEKIYDCIKREKNTKKYNEKVNVFLDNACFCSFVDSYFNYLRRPNEYKKEVGKVLKLYFAAYKSILKSDDGQKSIGLLSNADDYSNIINSKSVKEARKMLADLLETNQTRIINKHVSESNLYYNIIKEYNSLNNNVSVVTTNYTSFAEKMIGLDKDRIAYVHGRMDLFEDVNTKMVDKITNFSDDAVIFPFIFVQSGVKPVVNGYQIRQIENARKMILESDELIVLGFGVNYDDEHITNLLRERLYNKKGIKYFVHQTTTEKEKDIIEKIGFEDGIVFYDTTMFSDVIRNI